MKTKSKIKNTEELFVVTMYRWGCRENHSYILGTFKSAKRATTAMSDEEIDRGGKYFGEITITPINKKLDEDDFKSIFSLHKPVCSNCEKRTCIFKKYGGGYGNNSKQSK